ncbi:MAG: Rrf2 family transcriptional regulator [Bacteroidota bacterium]
MLRLSKKIEYALLAVQYLAQREGSCVSAKEMAEAYNLSFELISKVLQSLIKTGFVVSRQGSQGGYTLAKKAAQISVADVMYAIEGKKNLVECGDGEADCTCYVSEKCTIKDPLQLLQEKIDATLNSMTIAEMVFKSPSELRVIQ